MLFINSIPSSAIPLVQSRKSMRSFLLSGVRSCDTDSLCPLDDVVVIAVVLEWEDIHNFQKLLYQQVIDCIALPLFLITVRRLSLYLCYKINSNDNKMDNSEIKEHKNKFQLERLILFSDAVFAIAITLLVIELKLPELEGVNNKTLAHALVQVLPHFFSLLLSFMIIGIYWVAHHHMFYYVIKFDKKLLWLNLFLLFFIVLMPFSSNIYGVYSNINTAFFLYVFNISMLSLFNYLMYNHISKPGKNLSHGLENPRLVKYYKTRSWIVAACFGIGVLISLISSSAWAIALSRMSPLLIIPAMRIIRKRFIDVAT